MPGDIVRENLRSAKTSKELNVSLLSLLEAQNFTKITVKNICEEALISRATFYAHFNDKYDLLKECLEGIKLEIAKKVIVYEQLEKEINQFVHKNEKVIRNLISDADDEILGILFDCILTTLGLADSGGVNSKNVVLSNFYAGGLVYYLIWQVNNRFPLDVMPMNLYLYKIILSFKEWKQE